MKKLAFFVEGKTELLFIDKLVNEIAKKDGLEICHAGITGGSKALRELSYSKGEGEPESDKCEFFVMIFNCNGDRSVVTRIKEESSRLLQAGYQKLIGVRDLRPDYDYSEANDLKAGMEDELKDVELPCEVILFVMEIESLFLAEPNHYQKIDPSITASAILNSLNIDVINHDMELRPNPADDLNRCYQLGGKSYKKRRGYIQNTVDALDYDFISSILTKKFSSVKSLIDNIDFFFEGSKVKRIWMRLLSTGAIIFAIFLAVNLFLVNS